MELTKPNLVLAFLSAALLFAAFAPRLQAQSDISVRAILDPRRIAVGGQATFTIETTGAPAESLPRQIPAGDLSITYGGHNNSLEIVQGQRTERYSYVYAVRATQAGRFTVPALQINVGGRNFTTQSQELVVEEPSAAGRASSDTPYFLKLEVPKRNLYVGEVVPIKLVLHVVGRNTISGVGQPEMERENLVMKRFPSSPQSGAVDLDGRIYSTVTLQTSLFAINAGEITVGPCSLPAMYYESQEYARVPSIFRRANRSTFTSNVVTLNVKALPEEGRPADFTGAVGDFALTQTASPTRLATGDPISIDLNISGVGNFDSLEAPVMTAPDGWQLYPSRELVQNLSDGVTTGKVTYSQVAIPLMEHREIPPFRFSYFDPLQKKYITANSQPIPIEVAPDPSAAALAASAETPGSPADYARPAAGKPVAEYSDILTIIPTPPALLATARPLLQSPLFWAANALPALAFLGLVGTGLHRRWRARQAERNADLAPRTPEEILEAMRDPNLTRHDFYRETLAYLESTGLAGDPRAASIEAAALGIVYGDATTGNHSIPIDPNESHEVFRLLGQSAS